MTAKEPIAEDTWWPPRKGQDLTQRIKPKGPPPPFLSLGLGFLIHKRRELRFKGIQFYSSEGF